MDTGSRCTERQVGLKIKTTFVPRMHILIVRGNQKGTKKPVWTQNSAPLCKCVICEPSIHTYLEVRGSHGASPSCNRGTLMTPLTHLHTPTVHCATTL